jgi:hypothetical protein
MGVFFTEFFDVLLSQIITIIGQMSYYVRFLRIYKIMYGHAV